MLLLLLLVVVVECTGGTHSRDQVHASNTDDVIHLQKMTSLPICLSLSLCRARAKKKKKVFPRQSDERAREADATRTTKTTTSDRACEERQKGRYGACGENR